MVWKKKEKLLSPEEAIAQAKRELAPFWFNSEPLLAAVPVVLYGDWLRTGDLDFVRVAGGELRLERLVPAEFGRTLTLRFGIARILSETPRIRSTRAYAAFIYRP